MLSSIILLSNIIHSCKSGADGWNYLDVSQWWHDYTECNSTFQSPIDITISDNSCSNSSLTLSWTSQKLHYVIRNNGHSLQAIPFKIDIDDEGTDIIVLEALHHTNDTEIRLENLFYDTYTSLVNKGIFFVRLLCYSEVLSMRYFDYIFLKYFND